MLWWKILVVMIAVVFTLDLILCARRDKALVDKTLLLLRRLRKEHVNP